MPSDFKTVIDRLKQAYATNNDAALCAALGKGLATLRTWRSRGEVPEAVLLEAARQTGYSLGWLAGEAGAEKKEKPRTPADDRARILVTGDEKDLLDRYRALPPLLRDYVEKSALLAWLAYQDRKAYHASADELAGRKP